MNNRINQIETTPSRALREASERKAKKLNFYQNGKPFGPKLTVSIIPGKEFSQLEQLYEFLTEKTRMLNGVQHIFTINGEPIHSLDELEHDQTYIISGTKNFIPYSYGTLCGNPTKTFHTTMRNKHIREDDLKLLRPLSSKYNNVYSNVNNGNGINTQTREVRTITVVNNKNHSIYSKVILNLKSPKSYDLLLNDLGDAVQLKCPKIMFTSNGQMVKSVSHLKHDLAHISLFYIDNEYPYEPLSPWDYSLSNQQMNNHSESNNCNYCNGFSYHSNNNNHNNSNLYSYCSNSQPEINNNEKAAIVSNGLTPGLIKMNERKMRLMNQRNTGYVNGKNSNNNQSNSFMDKPIKEINDPGTTFYLEQLSADKYEQIQLYAEKLLNETSFQLQTEGLLPQVAAKKKNSPKITKKNVKIINPELTNKTAVKQRNLLPVEKQRNRKVEVGKRNNIDSASIKSDLEVLNYKLPNRKYPSYLSRSNERINEPLKDKKDITSLSELNLIDDKKSLTKLSVNNNKQRTIRSRAISPIPSNVRKNNLDKKIENNSMNLANNKSKQLRNSNENLASNKATNTNQDASKAIITQAKLREIEKNLHGNFSPPERYLSLNKIFGYNGKNGRSLVYLNTGELAFYSGVYAILWNHNTGKQRFYTEHENDITCLRVDPGFEHIATSHLAKTTMIIRIWTVKTLRTIKILTNKLDFVDMEFTLNNSLFILNGGKESNISLWNLRLKVNIANTSKLLDHNEQVFGLTVHPLESDIVVTYGKMHLIVWHFKKDKSIECRTALQMQSKIVKTIHCAEFLNDNSLLTGDSTGNLTVWAPFEINQILEFAIREVKGHESQLTCLKLTKENILISGDKDGVIKTWDVNDNEFRLLNAVKLPSMSGSITSITLPNKQNETMNIFIGTSNNYILKGSALQTDDYQIIFEGHFMAIRSLSIDQKNNIYTASLDRKICKWNENGLIWKTDANIQGMSSSVHPSGQVLAVGSANGIIIIINTTTGEAMQYIQLTGICIGCMSYSPNGNFLVAGCQDGTLHVIPVAENGRSYDKVSILKGPLPILTLQWSIDTQFILTSVDDNNYQELILWDLPNSRYIRNVTSFSNNLQWYNVTCSGMEDARGTWDNEQFKDVINTCKNYSPTLKCIVTGDENGFVRLFAYPCSEPKAAYFQYKQGGGSITDVKFSINEDFIVSSNFEGSFIIWKLIEYRPSNQKINNNIHNSNNDNHS